MFLTNWWMYVQYCLLFSCGLVLTNSTEKNIELAGHKEYRSVSRERLASVSLTNLAISSVVALKRWSCFAQWETEIWDDSHCVTAVTIYIYKPTNSNCSMKWCTGPKPKTNRQRAACHRGKTSDWVCALIVQSASILMSYPSLLPPCRTV